jgi:hypothetical protein
MRPLLFLRGVCGGKNGKEVGGGSAKDFDCVGTEAIKTIDVF